MTSSADRVTVAVIGAGPAGLAAAVEAARGGVSVALVDAGARLGGQYWRQGPPGRAADPGLYHDLGVFTDLAAEAEGLMARGRIRYLPRHHVWSLQHSTLSAVDRSDPGRPAETTLQWDYLVLAVGAFDRPVPFPGWDLPGVMTVGAAQSLLKGSGVVVGPRVLIAGTGPFLLPVAAALAARGARVVGVHEANHPAGWLRHLPALLVQPRRIREGAGYFATFARYRVPVRNRSMVVAAHGSQRLEAVTVARLDRHGNRRPTPVRRIEADILAVGYGFSTQSELPLALGCEIRVGPDQALTVVTDEHQRTSDPRVFAAGEITGIGGAQLAVAEGTIAGAAAARAARSPTPRGEGSLRTQTTRRHLIRRFAAAMHDVYPVPPAWIANLEADTVVCRCEEVTVAEIDTAIELGARDARTVKLLSRAGMGWCQGRECAYATASLIAERTGQPGDLMSGADRPVATPIPLGLVADGALAPD